MAVDLFDKCRSFFSSAEYAQSIGYPVNPQTAQALGLYPYFLPIDSSEGTEVCIEGRKFIMAGSNNYLGLTHHPHVIEASIAALREHGTSCTGSRFMNGTLNIHLELEERLARFVGKERALVFTTGYQTNLGTISALLGSHDLVVADEEVHASIIDGIRLSKSGGEGSARHFRHNDPGHLAEILRNRNSRNGTLVLVDGVYSMGGDISPLPDIISVCAAHGARLMVDDAHGLGVLGGGRGTPFHYRIANNVDLIMGTFSKSMASVGGFIAGDKEIIHWIQHFGRSFMFSASLPPACAAAASAALDVIEAEPDRISRLNAIAERMRTEIRSLGYDLGNSQTPIIPIIIGDQFQTLQAWKHFYRAGIYVNVALPPAVPKNRALLRTSYMATHTDDQLDRILSVFKEIRAKIVL